MTQNIDDILKGLEWYDNHKIAFILNCRRKAYLHLRHPWVDGEGQLKTGLDAGVGNGAHAGSVMHAGLATYYSLLKSRPLDEHRRIAAFKAMAAVYKKRFLDPSTVDKKHTIERLLDIADQYFDYYAEDDRNFRPVETELFFLIRIEPEPGDPPHFLVPFYYCGRTDGVWERISDGSRLVLETKTTSWSVDRMLVRMKINRQQMGYIYSLRQFPGGENVVGALPNIILVAANKVEFKRAYEAYTHNELLAWRRQTINIVQDWRLTIGRTEGMPLGQRLDHFYQNDQECTSYGQCPFFRLCDEGLQALPSLALHETVWTPLGGEEGE